MPEKKESGKKQILLRVSPALWKELSLWADEDFRSINGQIEFLLTESVRQRRRKNFTLSTDQSKEDGDESTERR